MALNLSKGGRFNLAKEAPKLKVAGIGLGWNPNEEENGPDFDLDVSAFLIGENGKIPADASDSRRTLGSSWPPTLAP